MLVIYFRSVYGFLLVLALALGLAACNGDSGRDGLEFENAWIRSVTPGMNMTAGFGKLINKESQAIEISSYSSPSFGDVSLHRTDLVDGMSRMREVIGLTIAPGETLVLEPGGYHLMLMMPSGDIPPGQPVTVELTAADGRSFSYELPVERR